MRTALLVLLITSSAAVVIEHAAAADFEMSDDGLYIAAKAACSINCGCAKASTRATTTTPRSRRRHRDRSSRHHAGDGSECAAGVVSGDAGGAFGSVAAWCANDRYSMIDGANITLW